MIAVILPAYYFAIPAGLGGLSLQSLRINVQPGKPWSSDIPVSEPHAYFARITSPGNIVFLILDVPGVRALADIQGSKKDRSAWFNEPADTGQESAQTGDVLGFPARGSDTRKFSRGITRWMGRVISPVKLITQGKSLPLVLRVWKRSQLRMPSGYPRTTSGAIAICPWILYDARSKRQPW